MGQCISLKCIFFKALTTFNTLSSAEKSLGENDYFCCCYCKKDKFQILKTIKFDRMCYLHYDYGFNGMY